MTDAQRSGDDRTRTFVRQAYGVIPATLDLVNRARRAGANRGHGPAGRAAVGRFWLSVFVLSMLTVAGSDPPELSNGTVALRWDAAGQWLVLTRSSDGREFFRMRPAGATVTAIHRVAVSNVPADGCAAWELRLQDGCRLQIWPVAGSGFVCGRAIRPAAGFPGQELTRWEVWEGRLTEEPEPEGWRVLGTGGLASPAQSPGSYVWLAVARPRSLAGLVAGWITHDRASGVWFPSVRDERVQLRARLDYGRVRLKPDGEVTSEVFAVGWFGDARLGLEQWAELVAHHYGIRLPPQPCGYCTWYSRPHGGASDEVHLRQLAELAARELAPFGFQVVQIDDKWQAGFSTNGPRRNFTTHDPAGPYPSGMKAAADSIRRLGLVPGLWYMPFAGTWYDPWFAPHADWFARREDGAPYETAWGGTCLDLTHPGARAHVESVTRRIVHEWGFRYLKLDGLWTGSATRQQYINSGYQEDHMGDARFHDPYRSNIEALREGLKLVREAAGPEVFLLGCNAAQNMRAYGAAMGWVDAMRVGPDNGPEWDRLIRGPLFSSRQYFLNGRVWYNDPDPVYVRPSVPLEQARLIASWVTVSGNLWMNSDWLPDLPAERLDILKRTLPSHGRPARPVDLFEREPARVWVVRDERTNGVRVLVGLFNWDAQPWSADEPLAELGLAPGRFWERFEFWEDSLAAPAQGHLSATVPARACRIWMLRPTSDHPQVISTSRHVTQGIVDVEEEHWDRARRTLGGRSRVVGRDPYELRVVLPETGGYGAPVRAWVTLRGLPGTVAVRVPVALRTEGRLVRIGFLPPHGGVAEWQVQWPGHGDRRPGPDASNTD